MASNTKAFGPNGQSNPNINHYFEPRIDGAMDTLVGIPGDRFYFAGTGRARTIFGPVERLDPRAQREARDGLAAPDLAEPTS